MIDMTELYAHADYPAALARFDASERKKKWSFFKDVHTKVTYKRCPICECLLDGSVYRSKTNAASSDDAEMAQGPTIDHYRPKDEGLYPFLKYSHRNYILMCTDCNNAYKGNLFPLFNNGVRATTVATLATEQPLIVNPIVDDLQDLFIVVFTQTQSGRKVLELRPKANSGYLHEKAKETIEVFSLGDCDLNRHSNLNVHNGRIRVLNDHYNKLYAFAVAYKAFKDSNDAQKENKKRLALNELHAVTRQNFGFTQLILEGKFVV